MARTTDVAPIRSEDYTELARIQNAWQEEILSKPNVVGVGIGPKYRGGLATGSLCISVIVKEKLPFELLADGDRVAAAYSGARTDVVETGGFFAGRAESFASGHGFEADLALDDPLRDEIMSPRARALTQHRRPAMGGDSVGHCRVTAGTIGAAAIDDSIGAHSRLYILSNNHVLADSNSARIGDPILQPGRQDGGSVPRDVIGRLARFIPIRFDGRSNLVDAAIAEVPFASVDRDIHWVGRPRGIAAARFGRPIQMTGSTTGYSIGRVLILNATLDVEYGEGRTGRFVQQIVTSRAGAAGDSGALILDLEGRAVGLQFAGSSTHSVANPISFVLNLLKIKIS